MAKPLKPAWSERAGIGLTAVYALFYAAYLVWVFWPGQDRILGGDFPVFYAAAKLAASGQAHLAYDFAAFQEYLRTLFGPGVPLLPWHYPPVFMLFIRPLAYLPYTAALYVWLAASGLLLLIVLRQVCRGWPGYWLCLAFPGLAVNLFSGQNGFLTAALWGAGALALRHSQVGAGLLLGLVCYKPHFYPVLPLALWAGRYWRGLAALIICSGLLCLGSGLAFGLEAWAGFFANFKLASELLASGRVYWPRLPTLYGAARVLGAADGAAWLVQGLGSVLALGLVFRMWRSGFDFGVRAAGLGLAMLLCAPQAYAYDLAILAPSLAFAGQTLPQGWRGYALRGLLGLAWLAPFYSTALVEELGLPLAAPVFMLCLTLLAWRAETTLRPEDARTPA